MKRNLTKLLSVVLAMLMLLSSGSILAFAEGTVKRTETLDLRKAEFSTDQSNEAEGWSWDAETLTLTLNGANFDTGEKDAVQIVKEKTTTINLVGESTIRTEGNGMGLSRMYSGNVLIKGDGTLNLEYGGGDTGTMDVYVFTLESGTVNIKGGTAWVMDSVHIKGGILNVDCVGDITTYDVGHDGFYILDDGMYISGGTVNIRGERSAVMVDGDSDYNALTADRGLVITGGDVTLYGGDFATWIGYYYPREIIIDSTGSVTIEGSRDGLGMYCDVGSIEVRKGTIYNPDNLELDMLFRVPDSEAVIFDADYSTVDAAIAKIPADLTPYTEESIAAVQAAVDAVDRELNVLDQRKVNDYAKAIEDAVNGLEEMTFLQKVAAFFNNLFNGNGEGDGECWLVKIFKAIADFFVKIFNAVIGIFR